ncbi:hypothetical protein [Streptomyces sp. 6N223]|uniref:hypothetical protein n=1 Tax=Streptomyces sp. 6N223 TaxID=3457412 RepID=UPI003FD194BB
MSNLLAADASYRVPTGGGIEGSCAALNGQCVGDGCAPGIAPEGRYHHAVARNISIEDPYLVPFMSFHLAQFEDDEPHIAFVADGSWAELDEAATEQLITDVTAWLGDLKRSRAHLAAARITRLVMGGVDAAVARHSAAGCPQPGTPELVAAHQAEESRSSPAATAGTGRVDQGPGQRERRSA